MLADRDRYDLALDDEMVAWVRDRLEQTEHTIADEAHGLTEVQAGRDPWARSGGIRTAAAIELDVADLRDSIDVDLEFVAACRAILSQLDATPVEA